MPSKLLHANHRVYVPSPQSEGACSIPRLHELRRTLPAIVAWHCGAGHQQRDVRDKLEGMGQTGSVLGCNRAEGAIPKAPEFQRSSVRSTGL